MMNSQTLLFRRPSVTDKLNFFKMLFESSEIHTDLALALLKVIHRELGNEQTRDRSAYKRYAETIESLRYHKADMLKQIVDAWNDSRTKKDPDWLSDGVIK
ncbi:hypothetical protein MASR2M66_21560 [Chloroflexota bacterium]